jgi:DNA transformation protein and related proteins
VSTPVSAIRNLGPRSVEMFARAGIRSAEEIRALGAVEAHRRLRAAGVRVSLLGLYALHAGLAGRDWRELGAAEKAWLRAAAAGGPAPPGLEAELDRLGLPLQPTISSSEKK